MQQIIINFNGEITANLCGTNFRYLNPSCAYLSHLTIFRYFLSISIYLFFRFLLEIFASYSVSFIWYYINYDRTSLVLVSHVVIFFSDDAVLIFHLVTSLCDFTYRSKLNTIVFRSRHFRVKSQKKIHRAFSRVNFISQLHHIRTYYDRTSTHCYQHFLMDTHLELTQ